MAKLKTKNEQPISAMTKIAKAEESKKARIDALTTRLDQAKNRTSSINTEIEKADKTDDVNAFVRAKEKLRQNQDEIEFYENKIQEAEKQVLYGLDVKSICKELVAEMDDIDNKACVEAIKLIAQAKAIVEKSREETMKLKQTAEQLYYRNGDSIGVAMPNCVILARELNTQLFISAAEKQGIEWK